MTLVFPKDQSKAIKSSTKKITPGYVAGATYVFKNSLWWDALPRMPRENNPDGETIRYTLQKVTFVSCFLGIATAFSR